MRSLLQAGDLYQRVGVETESTALDAAGQPIRTWASLVANLPARVEAVTGGESIRGRQVAGDTTLLVTVRYRNDVTRLMRVVYGGAYYGILRAADPYGDQRELRIECREAA